MGFYKDNYRYVTMQCILHGASNELWASKGFARWFMIPEKEQSRVFTDFSFNRYAYMDTLKPDILAFVKNYADYRKSWPELTTTSAETKENMDFLAYGYLLEQEATFTPKQRAENKEAFALFDKMLKEHRERHEELSMLSGKAAYMMSHYYRTGKDKQEVKKEEALLKKEYKENKELLPLADAVIKAKEKKEALQGPGFVFFRSLRLRFAEKKVEKTTAAFKARQQEAFLSTMLDPNASIDRVEWRTNQLQSGDFSYVPAPPRSGACQYSLVRNREMSDKYAKYKNYFALSKEETADLEKLTKKYYALPPAKRKEMGQRMLAGQSATQLMREELGADTAKTAAPQRKSVDISDRLHPQAPQQKSASVPTLTHEKTKDPSVREPADD